MKRGLTKNKKPISDTYLKWGSVGLKVSLGILLLILVVLLYLSFLQTKDIYEIYNILFRFPDASDFPVIYSGSILFIIVPFLTGILIGKRIEKR
jgi:hypothetical protein